MPVFLHNQMNISSMDSSFRWRRPIITLAVLFVINTIACTPIENDIHKETRRFKDTTKALNYMHELLPDNISLEEKCKRYALLLAMAAATGPNHESDVHELVRMDNRQLDERYQAIDDNRLGLLYMRATEKYRIGRLARPFLEIISCLGKIDTLSARRFLNDPELLIIVNLYKQSLGLPAVTISLDKIKAQFHPMFLASLRNLFEGLLDVDHLCETSQIRPARRYKNKSDLGDFAESSNSNTVRRKPLSLEMKRIRQNLHQQTFRERHLIRQRERSRLASRRRRILNPDHVRERNRVHKQLFKERKRQREELTIRPRRPELASDIKLGQRDILDSSEIPREGQNPYRQPASRYTEQQIQRTQYYLHLLAGLQERQPKSQEQQSSEVTPHDSPTAFHTPDRPSTSLQSESQFQPIRPLVDPIASFSTSLAPDTLDGPPRQLNDDSLQDRGQVTRLVAWPNTTNLHQSDPDHNLQPQNSATESPAYDEDLSHIISILRSFGSESWEKSLEHLDHPTRSGDPSRL